MMCPKTHPQVGVQTFNKIFKYECYNLFKQMYFKHNTDTTVALCAHLYVIIMFLGLAVRHFSLFGSTEEPVARLTKESCLRGQELHTCGKGKKNIQGSSFKESRPG